MRKFAFAGAIALALAGLSAPALADNPHDPSMRSAEARARDREQIRQMNLAEARRVKARDKRYARQWRAYRRYHGQHQRQRRRHFHIF